MPDSSTSNPLRWVIAAIAALAVVALLVWGDRESGVDDRDTDPEDVVVTTDAAAALPLTISIDLA